MTAETPDRMTAAELRDAFQTVNERLDSIETIMTTVLEGLTAAATAAQPPAAATAAGQLVTFEATIILVGIDDNGAYTYKAKGGQYTKFGVRIWPEVLPELGINPDELRPGPNPCNLRLTALMGERGPRKVISLTK